MFVRYANGIFNKIENIIMQLEDIPEEELRWTKQPIIGIVLKNAEKDSDGNPIDPMKYYKVAKHKPSGMLIIIATDRNMRHEFINDVFKKTGKLN